MSEGNLTEQDASQHEMDLDLADEDQIIAEISGRVTDKYIYEMKGVKDERGNPVIGLSYAGTNWACREFARQGEVIRVIKWQDQSTPDEPEYYKIAVLAQRFVVDKETGKELALDTNVAGKRQWKLMKKIKWVNGERAGEEIVPDPFAWEKCLSKATRNAKQTLMPTEMVKKLVSKALEGKNGQAVGRSAPRSQAKTPEGTKPVASASGGSTATKPEEAKKPAVATAPPTQTATGPTQTTAPSESAAKPKMSKDVLIQKLDAVTKMLFQTQDGAVARQKLAAITGKASPSDLSEEQIKNLGNAINAVVKKTAAIEGNDIIRSADKSVLWKGPEVPKQEAPAEEASDIMF